MLQRNALMWAVAALAAVAMVNAYSLTPTFASDIGGLGADSIAAMAVDSTGAYYVVGSTTSTEFNTTKTTGGASGTTTNVLTAVLTTAANGFVTKYNAAGARVWTTTLSSASAVGVTAITLAVDGNAYVCGQFAADVTVNDGSAVPATITHVAKKDVFAAALNATTGLLTWTVVAHTAEDDTCNSIAHTAFGPGTVVFTGAAAENTHSSYETMGLGSATLQDPGSPSGGTADKAVYSYVARVDAATGANEALAVNAVSMANNSLSSANEPLLHSVGRAVAFDANGFLFGLSSSSDVGYSTSVDVFLHVWPNNVVASATDFGMSGQFGAPNQGFADYDLYSASMGSDGVDIPVAMMVVRTGTDDVASGVVHAMQSTRLAIAGHTTGAAGSAFKFHAMNAPGYNDPVDGGMTRNVPSASAPWFTVIDGFFRGAAADSNATFYGSAGLTGVTGGLARDPVSGHFWIAGSWSGSGSVSGADGAKSVTTRGVDAVLYRVNAMGALQWLEVAGSVGDDTGAATGVVTQAIGYSPAPRPVSFLAGSFPGNLTLSPASTAPLSLWQKASGDAFVTAYDDLDDCGLQASYLAPYGSNACGVTTNFNAIGASLCLDQPGFPLCFCNMNVTGTLTCTTRGWNCAFMAPYYFGLLNVCNCPQLATPSANPLADVEARLVLCAPTVCDFGTLTGTHASCLPLVLDLINTCSAASAPTPTADRGYIAAFQGLYANCPAPTTSTGGSAAAASSTGFTFGAAPAAAAASTVVAGAAMFAGVALTAAAADN